MATSKVSKKTTAKKTTTAKTTTTSRAKATNTTSSTTGIPTKLLDTWLKGRNNWNHDDWISLLGNLRDNGFQKLADTDEGRATVGKYLETHRH